MGNFANAGQEFLNRVSPFLSGGGYVAAGIITLLIAGGVGIAYHCCHRPKKQPFRQDVI